MTIYKRVVFAIAFLPAAFELAIRLDDWMRYGVPLTSNIVGIEGLQIVDSLGSHARPNAVFRQFRINSLGFRGPEVAISASSGKTLIVVSGSSETFGLYESAGKEWPRQLEDSVNTHCAARKVVVLNAGFAGMSMPTVSQDLRLRILPMRPAVVVYHPQPAQYLDRLAPATSPPSANHDESAEHFALRSRARIRDEIKRAMPSELLDFLRRTDTERSRRTDYRLFDSLPVDRLDILESQLRQLVGTVRRGGTSLVLVLPEHRFDDTTSVEERRWLRAWERHVPKATASLFMRFAAEANERILRVARESTVVVVDPPFVHGRDRARMFADPVHYTDAGASVVASVTARALAQHLVCGT